jgi:hypothetical protein
MDLYEKKHLVLLGIILLLLAVQPFVHGFVFGFIVFDILIAVAIVVVLLVVFTGPRQRTLMLLLALPAVVTSILLHVVDKRHHALCAAVYHASTAIFFGAAVAVILHDAFRKKVVVAEQIVAGLNGFLLAGVAWGNVFLLVDLMSPQSFAIAPGATARMENVHERRFEFNHLSFVTLTGIGLGDVTPVGRIATTLTWIEAAFSQFYMAVVIGLLVGLKMASAATKPTSDGDSDSS